MKLLSAAAKAALTALILAVTLSNPLTARAQEAASEITPAEYQEIATEFRVTLVVEEDPRADSEPLLNPELTDRQAELIRNAYEQAKADNLPDPKLLGGLLMQETKAGAVSYQAARNKCYGVFQIKIGTALHVLREYPELIEKFHANVSNQAKLKAQLIKDDSFNTAVASKYVLILMQYEYKTVRELALAYNQGMAGGKKFNPQKFPYSTSVAKHINYIFRE